MLKTLTTHSSQLLMPSCIDSFLSDFLVTSLLPGSLWFSLLWLFPTFHFVTSDTHFSLFTHILASILASIKRCQIKTKSNLDGQRYPLYRQLNTKRPDVRQKPPKYYITSPPSLHTWSWTTFPTQQGNAGSSPSSHYWEQTMSSLHEAKMPTACNHHLSCFRVCQK